MLALSLAVSLLAAPTADRLPWVRDDWTEAKNRATASKKLVAVDVWATWCHTCLSMKNFVLTEAPLAKVADTHVWLALDYDLEKNAAFFAKFPIAAFPTFLVIDPVKEEVVARWVGSGSAEEMAAFFATASPTPTDPLALGNRALARGQHAEAAAIFEKALGAKSNDAALETRLIGGLIEALYKSDPKRCVERGVALLDRVDDSSPGVDAGAMISYCAEGLEPSVKNAALAKVKARLEKTEQNATAMAKLSIDDRSGLYSMLIDLEDALGNGKAADALTLKRLALLESAASAAKDPTARATFDAHRLECYLRLKRFPVAQKMLEATAKAMPKDFNPPWRLAVLFKATGDTKRGLNAIERALSLGYGPRRVRLHSTKIDLLIQAKRWSDAKGAIGDARADIKKMDAALVRSSWTDALNAQEKTVDAQLTAKSGPS